MKEHPAVIRELSGFREFLHSHIKRARKEDQKLMNPLGDDDDSPPSSGSGGAAPAAAGGEEPAAASPEAPAPSSGGAPSSGKNYKIYPGGSRYGGKPVVTRYKGKVYGPSGETQFKPNEQGVVSANGDKLSVKKPDSDHTQSWDAVGEGKRPVLRLK